MGFRNDITRTEVFNEFSKIEQNQFFGLKTNKVIFNIDTLYYSVFIDEENEKNIKLLVEWLAERKDKFIGGEKDFTISELLYQPFYFCHYDHKFQLDDMYDIFISSYLPNKDTPRIIIQLRSIGLWLLGYDNLIYKSFENVVDLLNRFGLSVSSTKINRIDYCFHSNIIQNSNQYFSDTNLVNTLESPMRKYMKVGSITDTVNIDYFSLGQRKSNNVFFRCYNKTLEVIDKNYKGIFFDIWKEKGLISEYDYYCLTFAYRTGSFNNIHIAKANWYLQYGNNDKLKDKLRKTLKSCYVNSDNITFLKNAFKGILPEVTTITNTEFQCKSKFFNSFYVNLNVNKGVLEEFKKELVPIFKILLCNAVITDYLTSKTVAFKTNGDYCYWWQRIQQCKVSTMYKGNLIRSYPRNLDLEKLRQRIFTSIASVSAYKNNVNDNNLSLDVADMLCVLNDNDVSNIVIDTDTGEKLEFKYFAYETIKKRKNRQLKSILKESN